MQNHMCLLTIGIRKERSEHLTRKATSVRLKKTKNPLVIDILSLLMTDFFIFGGYAPTVPGDFDSYKRLNLMSVNLTKASIVYRLHGQLF